MKKLAIVLGILVVLCGCFLGYASMQPDTFEVTRKATISAPASIVYPYISDFEKRAEWSPWDKRDPEMKKSFTGPKTGVGAKYEWSGNDEVGQGTMEITEAKMDEYVKNKLRFIEPFESEADTSLALVAKGDGVEVTWTMGGSNNLMGKVFSVFMDMDEMIGKDFEEGLGNLKSIAEADAKKAAEAAPPADPAAEEGAEPAAKAGTSGEGDAAAKTEPTAKTDSK